ncbi:MAG: hypothetical protein FJZ64_04265, partial [Chlamydiae bacterium]|nr:hypothetical protein [Chlamydiota bacterium]
MFRFVLVLCCFQLFAYEDYEESPSLVIEEEEIPPEYSNLLDLETMRQDFVLETKWIRIPGYPDAFNPSILRWQGKLLMCFRTYHPETRSTHHIALVHLN